jgi:hypothetical protein
MASRGERKWIDSVDDARRLICIWKGNHAMYRRFAGLICCAGLLIAPGMALGQPEDLDLSAARARIAELERENRSLAAEVAMLRKQLAELRGQANETEPPAADAPPPTETANADVATTTPTGSVGNTRTAAAGGSSTPAIQSIAPLLLRDMPADLRPHQINGWDKYTFPRAKDWLEKAYTGRLFEARMKLVRASVMKVGDRYMAQVVLESSKSKLGPVELTHHVRTNGWPMPVVLMVDEDGARRVDRMKPGHLIRVRGKIDRVVLRSDPTRQYDVDVVLKDYVIQPPME